MNKNKAAIVGCLWVLTAALGAGAPPLRAADDPFGAQLFSPELIMGHQADIQLKESQQRAIINEMKRMQSEMVEIQFKMKAAGAGFEGALSASKVDEAKALAALQELMKIENELKVLHVTGMVRIKNALTREQQEKLRKFGR